MPLHVPLLILCLYMCLYMFYTSTCFWLSCLCLYMCIYMFYASTCASTCSIHLHVANPHLYACEEAIMSQLPWWGHHTLSAHVDYHRNVWSQEPLVGVPLTVWRALQNILSKFVYCRNHTSYEDFNWNFVRVPKAMLWAHAQSFILKFSPLMWFLALYIFARFF